VYRIRISFAALSVGDVSEIRGRSSSTCFVKHGNQYIAFYLSLRYIRDVREAAGTRFEEWMGWDLGPRNGRWSSALWREELECCGRDEDGLSWCLGSWKGDSGGGGRVRGGKWVAMRSNGGRTSRAHLSRPTRRRNSAEHATAIQTLTACCQLQSSPTEPGIDFKTRSYPPSPSSYTLLPSRCQHVYFLLLAHPTTHNIH
jgi:hypothetical protein